MHTGRCGSGLTPGLSVDGLGLAAAAVCDVGGALARLYGWHRAMRIFDGPDEVHLRSIARAELSREKSTFAAAVT